MVNGHDTGKFGGFAFEGGAAMVCRVQGRGVDGLRAARCRAIQYDSAIPRRSPGMRPRRQKKVMTPDPETIPLS